MYYTNKFRQQFTISKPLIVCTLRKATIHNSPHRKQKKEYYKPDSAFYPFLQQMSKERFDDFSKHTLMYQNGRPP